MVNSFWWASKYVTSKGINWLNWDKIRMKKEFGGMGLWNIHGLNFAMLGKLGWKLFIHNDSIVTKVFKAKYFPDGGFSDAKLRHSPSYVWCNIHASRVLVREGMQWRIGNDIWINIRNQPWPNGSSNHFVTTPTLFGLETFTVNDLLHQ